MIVAELSRNLDDVVHKMFGFWDPDRWWYFAAAVCTIAIITYIYRDNIIFQIAEHLMVGLAAGYGIVADYYSIGEKDFVQPLFERGDLILIIPGILGVMFALRVFPKLAWLSRYPLAMIVGIGVGQSLSLSLQASVFAQVAATAQIDFPGYLSKANVEAWFALAGGIVLIVGTISGLVYFYFSKPHVGLMGGFARIGIVLLMIGFGASFGYTVQARITLFADRMLFMLGDWLGIISP